MFERFRSPIFLYAPDDGAGSGGAGDGDADGTGGSGKPGGDTPPADKTFTQADIDKIIADRLKRERKAWESTLEDERKKAAMTEAEKLKADKDAAEAAAKDAEAKANQRVFRAEAKAQALALGIKPERLDYALKLADLDDIGVDDNGEPDVKAIKAAIETVLKDLPELKGESPASKAGGDFSGGNPGNSALTEDAIRKMSDDEMRKRMPEIRAFYKSQPRK